MPYLQSNDDSRCVRKALTGDSAAFEALVQRYSDAVFAITLAHVHNRADAEDLTQEVFLQAYTSLHTLRDAKKFRRWLVRLAQNRARNALRRKRVEHSGQTILEQNVVSSQRNPECEEIYAHLHKNIQDLDESLREVLMLHYFYRKRTREIGELLGISANAAAKRLQRARLELGHRLVDALGEELNQPEQTKERQTRIMGVVAGVSPSWKGRGGSGLPVAANAGGLQLGIVASLIAVGVITVVAIFGIDRPPDESNVLASPGQAARLEVETDAVEKVESIIAETTEGEEVIQALDPLEAIADAPAEEVVPQFYGQSISGRVTFGDTGKGASRIRIQARYSKQMRYASGLHSEKSHYIETTTDEHGDFVLKGLQSRPYELDIAQRRYQLKDGPVQIRADDGDRAGAVSLVLVPRRYENTGDLEGFLTVNGVAVDGMVLVRTLAENGEAFSQGAKIGLDGYYRIPNIPPGMAGVIVQTTSAASTVSQITSFVRIGDEEITRFDRDFGAGTGAIEGIIETATTPRPGSLYVSGWQASPSYGSHVFSTYVDSTGYYVLEGLPLGEWEIALTTQNPSIVAIRLFDEQLSRGFEDEELEFSLNADDTVSSENVSIVRVRVVAGKVTRCDFSEEL